MFTSLSGALEDFSLKSFLCGFNMKFLTCSFFPTLILSWNGRANWYPFWLGLRIFPRISISSLLSFIRQLINGLTDLLSLLCVWWKMLNCAIQSLRLSRFFAALKVPEYLSQSQSTSWDFFENPFFHFHSLGTTKRHRMGAGGKHLFLLYCYCFTL